MNTAQKLFIAVFCYIAYIIIIWFINPFIGKLSLAIVGCGFLIFMIIAAIVIIYKELGDL